MRLVNELPRWKIQEILEEYRYVVWQDESPESTESLRTILSEKIKDGFIPTTALKPRGTNGNIE